MSACQPKVPEKAAADACADGGPTFADTSICVGRSVNFMDQDALAAIEQPREGCEWKPTFTRLGEAVGLLYMAATCKGVPAILKYDSGKLSYASGEMYVAGDQNPLIEIFLTEEADALSPLRAKLAALSPAEQAKCVIQPERLRAIPGAIVIGPTPAAAAKAPKDGPNAFCGQYGLNEDEANYWVVKQGKAMFFTFGQEQQDVAAGSVTLMAKDADGNWAAAADPRGSLGECLLQVGGKTYLDGVCEVAKSEDGGFQVFGKDYFAYASKLDGGKFNVSWNGAPESTHAQALLGEDFVEKNGCLSGVKGKVCAWDLGKRPK
jgi:hypothetical protein